MGGSLLAMILDAGGEGVLIAEGPRARRLTDDGLTVNGRHYGPDVDSEPESNDYSLILVATKSTHLQDALPLICRAVLPVSDGDRPATVASLLNGISSEEILRSALGSGSERFVVPAMILGIDAVRDGAEITYLHRGTIHCGADAGTAPIEAARLDVIDELLGSAGIPVSRSTRIIQTLWWKFMINVGINQASAVLRAPYGLFQRSKPARELMTSLMAEVLTLSRAAGTGLSDDHMQRWLETLQGLNPEGKTSMLQDVEAGRPTEVDLFAETVTQLGNDHSVPTPVNRTILHTIRAIEEQQFAT